MAPLASLDAYLARIGLPGRTDAGLAEVHRAHAVNIAFESFDPYQGRAVSLEPADLEDKLVARRRGGYCFEQNLLLAGALESLGVGDVDPILARARMGVEGADRPLNHLALKVVDHEGRVWLADVGFGGGGLLEPVPFETGTETEQSGWRYRLTAEGSELVLQVFQDGGWVDMYAFVPEPVPRIDIEVNNWYTATNPSSSFTTQLMCGLRSPERCLTLFVDKEAIVIERPAGGASDITVVQIDEVPALLAERFSIPGVSVDADGRLVLAGAAPSPSS